MRNGRSRFGLTQKPSKLSAILFLVLAQAGLSQSQCNSSPLLGTISSENESNSRAVVFQYLDCVQKHDEWAEQSAVLGDSIVNALVVISEAALAHEETADSLNRLADLISQTEDFYMIHGRDEEFKNLAFRTQQTATTKLNMLPEQGREKAKPWLLRAKRELEGIVSAPTEEQQLGTVSLEDFAYILKNEAEALQRRSSNNPEEVENRPIVSYVTTVACLTIAIILLTAIAISLLIKHRELTDRLSKISESFTRHSDQVTELRNDIVTLESLKTFKELTNNLIQEGDKANLDALEEMQSSINEILARQSQCIETINEQILKVQRRNEVLQHDFEEWKSQLSRKPEILQEPSRHEEAGRHAAARSSDLAPSQRSVGGPLRNVREDIAQSQKSSSGPLKLLTLEINALEILWNEKETQKLVNVMQIDGTASETWKHRFNRCFVDLPNRLTESRNLRSVISRLCEPLQARQKVISTLRAIRNHITKEQNTSASPNRSIDKIHQTRKFYSLLLLLTHNQNVSNGQDFIFEDWVRGKFRNFADELYREHWDRLQKHQQETLDEARTITDEILSWGHLEVIPTPLGTRFDSRHQIGHSTASRREFPDGTVAGVVRVGFLDTAKNQVIQKPEVVVNRR